MNYKAITYLTDGAVATITLNAPPLNIITIAMMQEICDAIDSSIASSARVIVFAGAGEKAFSAGVEIGEHTPDLIEEMLTSFHGIFRKLTLAQQNGGLITIAQVNGHCLGGGCELACFCDFVIATDNSNFGTPEIVLGCYPPVAAALFPAMIGRKPAERLMFTGEIIDSQRALALGLITDLVSEAKLSESTKTTIASITDKSAAVLHLLRQSEPDWRAEFLRQLNIAEEVYLRELTQLADMEEGILAFQEKRKPVWKNQ